MTDPLRDTDFWQHLAVGRAIWTTHAVPTTQLWSWPTYGAPDVNSSWGFRALLWPFWNAGGLLGLHAWRWLTTLAAFAILYVTARKMGARGLSAAVALVLCALAYSRRSQIRPETWVAVLFALQIALLEWARRKPATSFVRGAALAGVGWAWANSHISSPLWLVMMVIHLLDDWFSPSPVAGARRGSRTIELGVATLAGLALSLVNPFGYRALAQSFEFVSSQRSEAIFQSIVELTPLPWEGQLRFGIPVLIVGWPLLLLWRARRRGLDLAELLTCVGLTILGLRVQRFIGPYALAAAPFVARDLGEWLATRRWAATRSGPWLRALAAAAACIALGLTKWALGGEAPGLRMDSRSYPAAACDFIERHGIRGRAFNHFHLGGYMLYRFWPERERLPFMDIHQAGTPRHRADYAAAITDPTGWGRMRQYDIDYVMAWRLQVEGDRLLDFVDADTSFALVFADDAAALYVRRRGQLAAVADSFGYRVAPASRAAWGPLGAACATDSLLRAQVRVELERQAASPRNATAHSLLAQLASMESRWSDALGNLRSAQAVDRTIPRLRERIAAASESLAALPMTQRSPQGGRFRTR